MVGDEVLPVSLANYKHEELWSECACHRSEKRVRFWIRVCVAVTSEEKAWRDFTTGYGIIREDAKKEYCVPDGLQRHLDCADWINDTMNCKGTPYISPYTERLSILRVCSKLSHSAFRIFWSTNTFSFRESKSFGKFLKVLNDTQKGVIRKVNLDLFGISDRMDFDPCQLIKLQEIDVLHLSLHTNNLSRRSCEDKDHSPIRQTDIRGQRGSLVFLLEVVNIKCLRIIVYDSIWDFNINSLRGGWGSFTMKELRCLADMVHAVMMAPRADREVLAREYRQLFELEELLGGLRYALQVRLQMQRRSLQSGL